MQAWYWHRLRLRTSNSSRRKVSATLQHPLPVASVRLSLGGGYGNFFLGPVSMKVIEKRCNHYRQIVACMLSGARRDRPVIVGWSTLHRPGWVHEGSRPYSDPVPGCYLATNPVSGEVCPRMGLVNKGSNCGRPAHDHWMNSPSSGQHTAHYSPVIIAPFVAWGRRGSLPLFFWSGGREALLGGSVSCGEGAAQHLKTT